MPHASASRQVMPRSYVHYTAIRRADIFGILQPDKDINGPAESIWILGSIPEYICFYLT